MRYISPTNEVTIAPSRYYISMYILYNKVLCKEMQFCETVAMKITQLLIYEYAVSLKMLFDMFLDYGLNFCFILEFKRIININIINNIICTEVKCEMRCYLVMIPIRKISYIYIYIIMF